MKDFFLREVEKIWGWLIECFMIRAFLFIYAALDNGSVGSQKCMQIYMFIDNIYAYIYYISDVWRLQGITKPIHTLI